MVINIAKMNNDVKPLHVENAFRHFAILKTWQLMRKINNKTNCLFKKHFISLEMAICGYVPNSPMVINFAIVNNGVQPLFAF